VVDTHKKQLTKCKHGRYEIMTEQIDKQELAVLETRTATIDDAINTLQVVDAESYTMAGTMLSEINEHIRFVQGKMAPIVSAAHQAHKEAKKLENDSVNPAKALKLKINVKISDYLVEQARIKKEAETKAREAAEAAAKIERDRIEAEAEKALDIGDVETAQQYIDEAEAVAPAPVVIAPTGEKKVNVGNGNMSERFDLEVILPETAEDIKAACKAIADGVLPVNSVAFKIAPLKSHAQNNLLTGKHHGVMFKEKRSATIRREV